MNDPRRLARLESLALLAAQGMSLRAAAKRLGWAHRTAQKYAQMDEFRGRVREVQESITARAVGRLVAGQVKAAARLAKLVDGEDTPPAVQLAAARSVLQLPMSLGAARELAAFLKSLEATQDDHHRRLKVPGGAAGSANGQFRGGAPAG
jgi:hypothetical protein